MGIDVDKIMKPFLAVMTEMNDNLKKVIVLLEEVKGLLDEQNKM